MLILVRVLVFLGVVFATTSVSALTFGVNWHPQGEDTQAVANLMKSKNLRHLRFDAWFMPNNTPTLETIALASKMRANGVALTAVVTNPISKSVHNGYCPGDQQAIEAQAYNQTYPQVNGLKDFVNDFELLNEPNLYPNMLIGGQRAPLVNAASYNTQCSSTIAAVLRGMSRAVSDVGRASGKKLRSIVGATSDGSVGFLKLMQQKGVYFDVVGFHIYPAFGHANLFSDPWFGPNGPMGLVKAFGKPVHVNEFNCAEIYRAGFTNQPGSALMNECVNSLNKHLAEVVNNPSQIEVLDLFELFDRGRPGVCATGNPYSGLSSDAECRFGLMYSLTRSKPSMDAVTRFTGSAANSSLVNTPVVTTPAPAVTATGTPIIPQVSAGLPNTRDYVLNLYRLLFGREPATGEVDSWARALDAGQVSRVQMEKSLQANIEYRNRIGGNVYNIPNSLQVLPAYNFIDLLYKELLQRVASAGELNSWVASKQSKENMLRAFIGSAEYKRIYGL
ncbi:DUF4214 domain-containing protein [Ampullimonas aquatilis]|uniref:DUF4214 domain-containing protein n=1 Tax=Ampullimonas aquatilis TaxID=1341549 RepID=UPI003C77EAB3